MDLVVLLWEKEESEASENYKMFGEMRLVDFGTFPLTAVSGFSWFFMVCYGCPWFFIVLSWFVMVFSWFFQRTGFQRTGNPSVFIDGHPSNEFINGNPSMNIHGFPSMNSLMVHQ